MYSSSWIFRVLFSLRFFLAAELLSLALQPLQKLKILAVSETKKNHGTYQSAFPRMLPSSLLVVC